MTLPVFFAEGSAIPDAGGSFFWEGTEADHARKVMRLGPGDTLDLVDGTGLRATCTVRSAMGQVLELQVQERIQEEAPSVQVTLVQALAKAGRDEQAIEMCTELGVDRIVPWQAQRSIVKWAPAKAQKGRQKWVNAVRAATKQSRRSIEPEVADVVTTSELVEDLRDRKGGSHLTLVLDESATEPIWEALSNWDLEDRAGAVTLIVGPEGGIDESEVERLCGVGAKTVLVGPSVLRSSTAGAAALLLTNMLPGRWQ